LCPVKAVIIEVARAGVRRRSVNGPLPPPLACRTAELGEWARVKRPPKVGGGRVAGGEIDSG